MKRIISFSRLNNIHKLTTFNKVYFKNFNQMDMMNNSMQRNVNLAFRSKIDLPSVTIVRDRDHARRVINILKSNGNRFHSWDTETVEIDPKEQSPVGNGKIVCLSCFAGPDIDFGNGPSKLNI